MCRMVKRGAMNLHRMLKSKKGISPILATLLLIVIAVAAIIVTYAWVMTFIGAQTTSGGVLLEKENVYWNSTASTTSITVKNRGTSDAKIVRLYINDAQTNLLPVTEYTDLGTGKLLPAGETLTIVLSWPNSFDSSWTNGDTYYFKVVPEAGAELLFTDRTPSS